MTKTIKTNRKYKKKTYKKKDYNSGDGMLTTVWGPGIWHYLHCVSFNYPNNPSPKDKKCYRQLVVNLKNTLPCKYCRINLKKNFKNLPLTMKCMKNRETFSKYVYNLHELINKMLKKKSNLTYGDVRDRYEHFRSRCTKKNKIIKIPKYKIPENGCTESLYGEKSKCIIKIVPQKKKCKTFQMDNKCIKKRI